MLFYPASRSLLREKRERDLEACWWGREPCLLYFAGTGARSRKADVCGLPENSLADPRAVWVRGAETRRGKAGMTDTGARAWAPAVPMAGSGSRGGSAPARIDAPSIRQGLHTPFDFFPFTPNTRNKQKLTAWEEAGYVLFFFIFFFFCAAFHLFWFFGWLQNLKPKDDWNASPGGGGSRAPRTPSSGLASNCRREGNAAGEGGGWGGLLQLLPWAG